MIGDISFATSADIDCDELASFYERQRHDVKASAEKLRRMVEQTFCFVTARRDGELIGIARGITDGVHGFLAECKLDPRYQGPACVTRTDGRIEHDDEGIARQMADRVVESLISSGVDHISVLAYGTEVDFCEELGFKRVSGMVPLQLAAADVRSAAAPAHQSAST